MTGVPWRRALLLLAVVAVTLGGIVAVLRADGFRAVDATVPRATRWFVDSRTGFVVLADGFSGATLARIALDTEGAAVNIVQSASGVALIDRSAATARNVDSAALRLGPPQSLSLAASPEAVFGVGQTGLVTVDPSSSQAVLLPPGGEQVPIDLGSQGVGTSTRVAPDGSVWTIDGASLARITTTGRQTVMNGLDNGQFTLVGNTPLVFDAGRQRARFGDGRWVNIPDDVPSSEIVMQQPGPNADCGWLGGDNQLWCVGTGGIDESATIDGLDINGPDLLSIAGNAGAVVRRQTSQIVRLDWRAGRLLDGPNDVTASVTPGVTLAMAASVDLIWVDEIDGSRAWSIHPWGIQEIDKSDERALLLGETGDVVDAGAGGTELGPAGSGDLPPESERQPDNNGIDDPPVAIADSITARTGIAVPVAVTANDYDPDGEAIALVDVGPAEHGSVDILTADIASYTPETGFVGVDEFDYTIVDGNGSEATATVTIELLPADAPNQPPVAAPDVADTGSDTAVVVDVLLNDIDPERDALRIASFTPADVGGTIVETTAASGLPGLQYTPLPGESGTATFSYRPVDAYGATGEAVNVTVEIAQPNDANRPPIVSPDSVRARRDVAVPVPVLANDRDPDGDRLRLGLVTPLPPGLEVRLDGDQLQVTVRAGAARLLPFNYTVSDDQGHTVTGSVLVVVVADDEPNRPPLANDDAVTAVIGATTTIDVLVNDSDPDGDPIALVSVSEPDEAWGGTVRVTGDTLQYTAGSRSSDEDDVLDRFTYEITDGNGESALGQVTVRILPERVASPPVAGDDSATTNVDVPVTIDVLRNDLDPSGERPSIVGTPGCAGGGRASVTDDNRVKFVPPAGQTGIFSCRYEVTNSQGLLAGATIVVSVISLGSANVPPVVVGEQVVVVTGQSVVVPVLENDSDPDGPRSELRLLSSSTPTLGTASRTGGTITFVAGSVTGFATITYQVGDADGGVTTGRLQVQIVPPDPIAPIAIDDLRTIVGPASATLIDVLANDIDPDGNAADLEVVSVSVTAGSGSASNTARSVTLTPPADFVGNLVASYVVRDASGLTDNGQVTLTVLTPPNRAPIAIDDAAEVVSGGTVTVPIAFNDSDPDGDQLAYSITSPADPAIGTAQLQNGALVFVGTPGASGTATIQYAVDDGSLTSRATVRINVLACAEAPPLAPDVFLQTGYQQPIAIDLNNYASNGSVVDVGPPLGAPSGVYTPPAGENGNISFTYAVRNSCRLQAVGTVTIDVNQQPLGSAYGISAGRTQPFTIPVTALASDAEPLTIGALEGAPDWIAVIDGGTNLSVVPAGRSGSVELAAVIVDPGGLSVSVPITIDLVNLAPIANPDVVRVAGGAIVVAPLANDLDPDGDSIALQSVPDSVTFPNGVTVAIERIGNDQLRIAPGAAVGTVTFSYTVVDALGVVSAPSTITITVNTPPVAGNVDVTLPANSSIDVVIPASDADLDQLTVTIDDDPSPLSIVVDGLTARITAPLGAANSVITVGYTVTDPDGATASAVLTVTVVPPVPPAGP